MFTTGLMAVSVSIRWIDLAMKRKDDFDAEAGASAYHWNTLAQIEVALKSAKAGRRKLEAYFTRPVTVPCPQYKS
jgi:hypothetical protein